MSHSMLKGLIICLIIEPYLLVSELSQNFYSYILTICIQVFLKVLKTNFQTFLAGVVTKWGVEWMAMVFENVYGYAMFWQIFLYW